MKKTFISFLFLFILIAPQYVLAGNSSTCPNDPGIGACESVDKPDFYWNSAKNQKTCMPRMDCGLYEVNCGQGTCYGPTPPPPTYACPVGNANWANPDVDLLTNNCCTNGQVPTWDDTNQKWVCTSFSETDPQVSSSTSNYVPKWNGSTLVDGIIYDNGNVGIGTTGPNAKLYVAGGTYSAHSGSSNDSSYAIGTNSIGADESIYSYGAICTNNAWGNCGGSSGVVLGIDNNSATVNIPSSGDAFFNGGKVGIGTATPTSLLHVQSTTSDASGGMIQETVTGDNSHSHRILTATKAKSTPSNGWLEWLMEMESGNTPGLDFYRADRNLSGTGLSFSQPQLHLSWNGNVGIGTSDPAAKLQVNGNLMVGYFLTTPPNTAIQAKGSQYGGYFDSGDAANGVGVYGINSGSGFGVYGSSASGFGMYSSAPKNYFSGKVGIGTVAPAYKLDVVGDIRAQGAWLRTTGATGWYNDTYGGGWYMTGTDWIEAYNGKSIWTNGDIANLGGVSVGWDLTVRNEITATGNLANDCAWTGYVSEEQPGGVTCPSGKFVNGIKCSGDYCDNVSVKCCYL